MKSELRKNVASQAAALCQSQKGEDPRDRVLGVADALAELLDSRSAQTIRNVVLNAVDRMK